MMPLAATPPPPPPGDSGGNLAVAVLVEQRLGLLAGEPVLLERARPSGPVVLSRRTPDGWRPSARLARPGGAGEAVDQILGDRVGVLWERPRGIPIGVSLLDASPGAVPVSLPAPPFAGRGVARLVSVGRGVGLLFTSRALPLRRVAVRWSEWSPERGAWTPAVTLGRASSVEAVLTVAASSADGAVTVVMPPMSRPVARVRAADGTWGPAHVAPLPPSPAVPAGGSLVAGMRVAPLPGGRALAVWPSPRGMTAAEIAADGSWSSTTRLGRGPESLALGASPSGRAVVAWADDGFMGPVRVRVASREPDGTWGRTRLLAPTTAEAVAAAVGDDGAAVVVTASTGLGPSRGGGVLVARRPAGASAFTPLRPLGRDRVAAGPEAVVPAAGPAIVSWVGGPGLRRLAGRTAPIAVGR